MKVHQTFPSYVIQAGETRIAFLKGSSKEYLCKKIFIKEALQKSNVAEIRKRDYEEWH